MSRGGLSAHAPTSRITGSSADPFGVFTRVLEASRCARGRRVERTVYWWGSRRAPQDQPAAVEEPVQSEGRNPPMPQRRRASRFLPASASHSAPFCTAPRGRSRQRDYRWVCPARRWAGLQGSLGLVNGVTPERPKSSVGPLSTALASDQVLWLVTD